MIARYRHHRQFALINIMMRSSVVHHNLRFANHCADRMWVTEWRMTTHHDEMRTQQDELLALTILQKHHVQLGAIIWPYVSVNWLISVLSIKTELRARITIRTSAYAKTNLAMAKLITHVSTDLILKIALVLKLLQQLQ